MPKNITGALSQTSKRMGDQISELKIKNTKAESHQEKRSSKVSYDLLNYLLVL